MRQICESALRQAQHHCAPAAVRRHTWPRAHTRSHTLAPVANACMRRVGSSNTMCKSELWAVGKVEASMGSVWWWHGRYVA